jgi:hypothetical protein
MRFPAGLRARLLRRSFSRVFGSESPSGIFHFSPLKNLPAGVRLEKPGSEAEWYSPEASVQAAEKAGAPVVWLGGTEPLFDPAIGEVASALAESGRYVFLHTSGVGLRKRIHEFEPVPGLYLTLEIPGSGASARNGKAASEAARAEVVFDAIRGARLSGFHVCGHLSVDETTSRQEIAESIRSLEAREVDGIVVSSGGGCSQHSKSEAATSTVAEAVRLIPSTGWRSFSRLLESSYSQHVVAERVGEREVDEANEAEASPVEETA